MKEELLAPWPWYVSGALIAGIMVLLLFFGKSFGFSSNFRTICSACGAGKRVKFFDFNWKTQIWNILFLVGSIIGGLIAHLFMSNGAPVIISDKTIKDLTDLGIAAPQGMQPEELFGMHSLTDPFNIALLAFGGLLIGFGTRYAGGCTSGHAISGLSNLQLPSLIAVIGFFIGGLTMTFIGLPLILK